MPQRFFLSFFLSFFFGGGVGCGWGAKADSLSLTRFYIGLSGLLDHRISDYWNATLL